MELEKLQALLPAKSSLLEMAASHQQDYKNAVPYPHIQFDNMFSPAILDAILDEFPRPDGTSRWQKFDDPNQKKLASRGEELFGPVTKFFLHYLNSEPFLEFLQGLTGINEALIADPYYSGGGLHQIKTGGLLKIHSDFNKHPKMKLDRRLNLIIYLNKNWLEAYRGHFEIWDKEMKHCVEKILPVFNRMVVFSTSTYSYHGHPDALMCPPEMTRKSLALYYYTNGRPAEEIVAGKEKHTTLFQARSAEEVKAMAAPRLSAKSIKRVVKLVTPPVVWDALKKIKK